VLLTKVTFSYGGGILDHVPYVKCTPPLYDLARELEVLMVIVCN